jgi:hypothetical protein
MNNTVRFIELRRPVREILAHDGTTAGSVCAANAFRDEILSLEANTVNERYRARLVQQGNLWKDGVRLGYVVGKSITYGDENPDEKSGYYYGGKWGIHLRAPDLWFKLVDDYGRNFALLVDVVNIRRGITSGKDCFFFPKDCSTDCLDTYKDPIEFKANYGVSRKQVQTGKGRLVRCGNELGEIHPIESKYLEPEVHSLMEVDSFTVSSEACSRLVLLVGKSKNALKDTYVLNYIEWGEKQNYHVGATCTARITTEREWYDLTGHKRGVLFWPKSQQYKHIVPINKEHLQCNCNLYDIHLLNDIDAYVTGGVLNSSFVVLSKFQYGRPVGVEGALKTEVVDVKMMLVPDPRSAATRHQKRVAKAFEDLQKRKVFQFLSERRLREMTYKQTGKEAELKKLSDKCELDMPDRRELDDAVLEMLGVRSKRRRQELIDELYEYLRQFFEGTRQKEEKAIANKKKAKRRGPARPTEIAAQIYEEINDKHRPLLRRYDPDFLDKSKPFDTFELPAEGLPELHKSLFDAFGVAFMKGKKTIAVVGTKTSSQDPLVILVGKSGVRGLVRIPHEEEECNRVLKRYGDFVQLRENRIHEIIEHRTADEVTQEKIYDALMQLIVRSK